MIERRASGNIPKQCARFGCSAVAIATFTFDSATCTVWLDTPSEGNARAGELCARHARLLKPPRGWQVEDRRASSGAAVPAPPAPERAATPAAPEESYSLEESPPPSGPLSRQLAAGPACSALEDELRGLLDAHSPLLARAFRSSGTV